MLLETFVSTRLWCNNPCRQRNFFTVGYTTAVYVVQSKGRQQEPTAPTAARLIGCGVALPLLLPLLLCTLLLRIFLPFFWYVIIVSVPTALLRAR